MQTQPTPNYTYDALGRLVMISASGAANDVNHSFSQTLRSTPSTPTTPTTYSTNINARNVNANLAVREREAIAITATGLVRPTVLNAQHLFTPAVSINNPPTTLIPSGSQASPGTIIATSRPFLRP